MTTSQEGTYQYEDDYPGSPMVHAAVAADAIRSLNHASIRHECAEWPSDIGYALSSLAQMAAGLPQAMEQLGRWVDREEDFGRLRDVEYPALPAERSKGVVDMDHELHRATYWARELAECLNRAHSAVSRLVVASNPEDDDI